MAACPPLPELCALLPAGEAHRVPTLRRGNPELEGLWLGGVPDQGVGSFPHARLPQNLPGLLLSASFYLTRSALPLCKHSYENRSLCLFCSVFALRVSQQVPGLAG